MPSMCCNCVISSGISPPIEVPKTNSHLSVLPTLPISFGIVPVNPLPTIARSSKGQLKISLGIPPEARSSPLTRNDRNKGKLPNSGGSE